MKCRKCGRKLRDVKSIERGYGPVCWGRESGASGKNKGNQEANQEECQIPGQMSFANYPGVLPEEGGAKL